MPIVGRKKRNIISRSTKQGETHRFPPHRHAWWISGGFPHCDGNRHRIPTLKAVRRGVTMADAPIQRPISPHIQIYEWTLPFLMSGFHRATGFALYFGFVLIAWWLTAAASGPSAYANVQWFFGTFIGRLVLFGYSWGLIHHTLGGIRHLIWDTGRGLEPRELQWFARATIIGSIALT